MTNLSFLQFVPSVAWGGCEHYALTVAREVRRRGATVHVAMPHDSGVDRLAEAYEEIGAVVHRVVLLEGDPGTRRGRLTTVLAALWLLLKVRPSAAHIVLPWPPVGFGAIVACGLMRVCTTVVFQLVADDERIIGRTRAAYLWAKRRSQRWIAVSQDNRRLLAHKFGVDERFFEVVYNGTQIDETRAIVRADDTLRNDARQQFGVTPDQMCIVAVGRLHRQKGFDLLLDAFPLVLATHPSAVLLIAGDGPEREALTSQASDLGISNSVSFLGHRSDIATLHLAADVFAFPSRSEGFPFALLEAIASGLPVVASATSAMPEIIVHRSNGLLVIPNCPKSIASGIEALLGDREFAAQLGKAAELSAKEFSVERMLSKTVPSISGAI